MSKMSRDVRTVLVGTASTQILGPNANRFAIIIGPPLSNRVCVELAKAAVLDQSMPLYPGTEPFEVLYDHVGGSLREEIYAIAAVAAQQIVVWDILHY